MREIPEGQAFVNALVAEHLADPVPVPEATVNGSMHAPVMADDEVVRLCRNARNAEKFTRLFDDGDTSAYGGDDSAADMALVSRLTFYSDDPAQIDRLFRRSALMRPKWNARRGATTYGRMTIERALKLRTERYRGGVSVTASQPPNRKGDAVTPKLRRLRDVPDPGPMRYLVEGIVPRAFPTMIYGDGGVAKSMLAMSLATAVAGGAGAWVGRAVESVPVAFVDFELDESVQRRRALRLARGRFLDDVPEELYYVSAVGEPAESVLDGVLAECREAGVGLVVVDSLGMALAGDPNSSTDVVGFHRRCIDPFRAAGITTLLVDHQGKTGAGERYQSKRAFGSVYKENCARSVLQVEPNAKGKGLLRVRLRHTKTNFGERAVPFGLELRFTEERVTVEPYVIDAGGLAEEHAFTVREKVLLWLLAGPAFPKEIADAVHAEYGSVKNEMVRLRREGLIEDTGERDGQAQQVRLTESGRRVAGGVTASQPSTGGDDTVTPPPEGADDDEGWETSL